MVAFPSVSKFCYRDKLQTGCDIQFDMILIDLVGFSVISVVGVLFLPVRMV